MNPCHCIGLRVCSFAFGLNAGMLGDTGTTEYMPTICASSPRFTRQEDSHFEQEDQPADLMNQTTPEQRELAIFEDDGFMALYNSALVAARTASIPHRFELALSDEELPSLSTT